MARQNFVFNLFLVFVGAGLLFSYFSGNYGQAYYGVGYYPQYNTWNHPSYYGNSYGQNYYGYNSGHLASFSNYYGAYNSVQSARVGFNTFLMPSYSYNPVFGYRPNYDSQITVSNALDNVYYQNPSLLAPRGTSNHQLYVRGLWPQQFYY